MNANTNTAAQTVHVAGDVVCGHPVIEGKKLNRRKGIVLGFFNGDQTRVIVWWFTMKVEGTADATTLMFASELTKAGDIFDTFRARRSEALAVKLTGYGRARMVRNLLISHARRMRSIGAL